MKQAVILSILALGGLVHGQDQAEVTEELGLEKKAVGTNVVTLDETGPTIEARDKTMEISPLGSFMNVSEYTSLLDTSMPELEDMALPPELGRTSKEIAQWQLLKRGEQLISQREYSRAISVLADLVDEAPQLEFARLALSTAYIESRQYEEADTLLTELAEKNPGNYMLLNNLAWLYATADDLRFRDGIRASGLAREALLVVPNNYHVWSTLSEAYYVSGRYQQGFDAAKEAYTLAMRFEAPPKAILEYAEQLEKCRNAMAAMSILD